MNEDKKNETQNNNEVEEIKKSAEELESGDKEETNQSDVNEQSDLRKDDGETSDSSEMIVEEVMETSAENEENESENEITDEEGTEQKKKEKKSIFTKYLGTISPLTGLLILISIFGLVVFFNVKDQIQDNTVKMQKDIVESIHYIDLYEATGEERYVIHLYGELRNMDTLLRQTTVLSISYPSIFNTSTKSNLLNVIDAHVDNLEDVINYQKQLDPKTLIHLRNQLTNVTNETNGIHSFKTYLKEANKVIE